MTCLSAAEMAFSFVDGNYGYYLNHAALPGQETDGADMTDGTKTAGGENMTDSSEASDSAGQAGWMDGRLLQNAVSGR